MKFDISGRNALLNNAYKKSQDRAYMYSLQIQKIHERKLFNELAEKAIIKYESDSYKDKFYNKGLEPPEDLFYILYEYAFEYGELLSDEEMKMYNDRFVTEIIKCGDYIVRRSDGQGVKYEFIKI